MIWSQAQPVPEAIAPLETNDHVTIRGRRLPLAELVDSRLFDPGYLTWMRESLACAQPFAHLVVDGWFNPTLLELVHEEFDLYPAGLQSVHTKRERTYRSQALGFGPATNLYFSIVNGGWFVEMLSNITNTPALMADPSLYGGGLHESRHGGTFAIHRDFDHHPRNGLYNEMVLLTYLNKEWQPEWNGALELWDATATRAVKDVLPEFGRSVVLLHGRTSYHGHVKPLQPPSGITRRSLGAYYYSNRLGRAEQGMRPTNFLLNDSVDRAKLLMKNITPPVLWHAIKRLVSR